jgi:hypothetical protein
MFAKSAGALLFRKVQCKALEGTRRIGLLAMIVWRRTTSNSIHDACFFACSFRSCAIVSSTSLPVSTACRMLIAKGTAACCAEVQWLNDGLGWAMRTEHLG